MRNAIIFVSLVLLLAGCASPATATATPITTSILTDVPSSTPTPTLTPVPTVDSNAPQGGYTRVENGIYYLDKTTESGTTLTYIWDKERGVWERQIFHGAVWEWDKQSSNDIKAATGNKSDGEQLPMTVYIDGPISGEQSLPTLTHHDNVDPRNILNWTLFFQSLLYTAMANKGIIKHAVDFKGATWFFTHDYHFDFMNADGPQQWGLWDKSAITVHIRGDYDKLKADMATNGFSVAKSNNMYGPTMSYMVKVWTKDGNLFTDIAPNQPASAWTQKQIMEMILFGPAAIMEQTDLAHPQSASQLGDFVLNQDKFKLINYGPPQ